MKFYYILIIHTLFIYSCANTKTEVQDVYFKMPKKEKLIPSLEYHNEIIATRDISSSCADVLLNNAGPSSEVIVELIPLADRRLKLLNLVYSNQDQDIAKCIQEILAKYEFPEFGLIDFKIIYRDGTYYPITKTFKCKTNHVGEKFKYVFEPYSTDEFKRSMPVWDAFILTLTMWTMGCDN